MSPRRLFAIGVLVVVLLFAAQLFLNYQHTFQTLTITNHSRFSVAVYAPVHANESDDYDRSSLFFKTSEPSTHKLKKGVYVLVVSGPSADYKPSVQQIALGDDPVRFSIPSPDYTKSYLDKLLRTEEPAIKATIKSLYSQRIDQFTVQGGKLYKNGVWYAAKLVPLDPASYDTYRIIMKKGPSGSWVPATDPPEIVLGAPVYPNIPADILSDIDSR